MIVLRTRAPTLGACRMEKHSARRRLHRRDPRRLRRGRSGRLGGREAVIVLELAAALLGVAGVAYLVIALVKPEKF